MNNKWIMGVLVFIFLLDIFALYSFDEDLWLYSQISIVAVLAITTSLMIVLVLHYWNKSKEFATAYIFLTLSLASYTIAELLWGYFDSIGSETYPSLADLFYGLYFVNAILFCITFIWNKRCCMPFYIKITGIVIGTITFSLYLGLSANYLDYDTFVTGTIMMALSSILMGVAVTAALIILKNPKLRIVWIMYGIAFVGNSIADIFYYSTENMGVYQYTDWTNIMWFGTILLIFYGGFIHNYLYRKS
jgi:hypothetical protein